MNPYILSTRIKIPQPRRNYISRKILFQRLDTMPDYKISLIKGGPGSGKTTLLSSYIKARAKECFLWLNVNDSFNEPVLFWDYLIEAFSPCLGDSKDLYLEQFNQSFSLTDIKELLIPFMNMLTEYTEQSGKEIFLVIDDFHALHNKVLLEQIGYLFEQMAPSYHFILLTRDLPELYLSAYQMQGVLLTIEEEALRLTREESFSFLKDCLQLSFSDQSLLYLTEKAEGWIGGLQLIAAASMGKSEQEVVQTTNTDTYISEYLNTEIFNHLTDDERGFLIATSPLPYFSQKICCLLFPEEDFGLRIETLMSKNLLIQCLDEQEGLYRYHHILEEFLRCRFDTQPHAEQTAFRQKASRAFFAVGEYEEGLHQLYCSRDYEMLMEQLLQLPLNISTSLYYMKIPVDRGIKNINFMLHKFFAHYCNYDFSGCQDIYDIVIPYKDTDERYKIFEGLELLFSDSPVYTGFPITTEEELETDNLLPASKALIYVKNGSFYYYRDNFQAALHSLELSIQNVKGKAHPYIEFFYMSLRSQIYEELGYFTKSLGIHAKLEETLTNNKNLSVFFLNSYISITGVYLKQMKLDDADKALSFCQNYIKDKTGQILIAYEHNLAEYYCLAGRSSEGVRLIKKLLSLDFYENLTMVANLLKYIWLYDEMSTALTEQFIGTYKSDCGLKSMNSKLLYARLLHDRSESLPALKLLDDMLSYARKEKIYLKIVETALCKITILLARDSDSRLIPDLYREALYYACYEDIYQPFYFEKDTIAAIHKKYGTELTSGLSDKEQLFHSNVIKNWIAAANQILSEREQEVLQALASGKTNKEIGSELYISLATVKTHILNVYRKLEVNSRVAAAEKGRKLGLIKD